MDGSLTSATSFRLLLGLENLDISYNNIESLSRKLMILILIEADTFYVQNWSAFDICVNYVRTGTTSNPLTACSTWTA
jgi:hypothetical protein